MVMGMPMIVGAHTLDEVQLALDWASDSVESYCERKFGWVSADTVFVDPYRGNGGRAQAMLPNPPVSNVSTVLGLMPVAGSLNWVALQNFAWAADGLLYDTTRYVGYNGVTGSTFWSGVSNATGAFDYDNVPSWPSVPRGLQVTYDHGYQLPETTVTASGQTIPSNAPPLPDGVISAVIKGASFYLDNPSGAIENRVSEITNRYEANATSGWLDEKLLGQFRMVYL